MSLGPTGPTIWKTFVNHPPSILAVKCQLLTLIEGEASVRMEVRVMVDGYFKAIKEGELMKVEQMNKRNPSLVNAKDESGMGGIAVATYYGQPKVASLLISRGATLNVFEAAMVGDLTKVRDLVVHERSLANAYSADGFTALHLAAFFGQPRVVEFLV